MRRSLTSADQDQVMTRAAEQSAELTMRGMIVGTISYMSPEQAQGKELDSRTDVFSFGVLLHEMLSGRRPFDGDTAAATMAKIIEAAPEPLEASRPEASPRWIRVRSPEWLELAPVPGRVRRGPVWEAA